MALKRLQSNYQNLSGERGIETLTYLTAIGNELYKIKDYSEAIFYLKQARTASSLYKQKINEFNITLKLAHS
jgi:hypothetical protein